MYYYLDDLSDKLEIDLGSVLMDKKSMLDFSTKFDPQKFHLDDEIADKMFGGIIASGWHTASLGQKLMVENFLGQAACMASPGLDELLFLRPVFAEDTLRGKLTIISTRVSASKPDRGVAKINVVMTNQKNEPVLSLTGNIIVGCRPQK